MTAAEQEILEDWGGWPIIAGSGGIRKARAARGNSGKSGGVRILYYCMVGEIIYFLDIYAKNEQANITEASKKFYRETVKYLKEQHYGKVH